MLVNCWMGSAVQQAAAETPGREVVCWAEATGPSQEVGKCRSCHPLSSQQLFVKHQGVSVPLALCRSLDQQVSDLSRQVQRLLLELQSAQSGVLPGASSPTPAFAGGDANDVTTQVLLEFKDIQVGAAQGRAGQGRRSTGRAGAA